MSKKIKVFLLTCFQALMMGGKLIFEAKDFIVKFRPDKHVIRG